MSREEDFATMAGSGALGAGAGWGITQLAGMSAAGMVGGGSGFGMAAGPVGAIVGGLAGLALWGVTRGLLSDEAAVAAAGPTAEDWTTWPEDQQLEFLRTHRAVPSDCAADVEGQWLCYTCGQDVVYSKAAERWEHVIPDLFEDDDA